MAKQTARYSDHLDVLLALITYLALTGARSRTPAGLCHDLGLEVAPVIEALDKFPGIFRRGNTTYEREGGHQHSYTLHARYARQRPRPNDPDKGEDKRYRIDGAGEELDPETLRALLDFVSEQARAERNSRHHRTSQLWVVVGVALAATASVVAAAIQAST